MAKQAADHAEQQAAIEKSNKQFVLDNKFGAAGFLIGGIGAIAYAFHNNKRKKFLWALGGAFLLGTAGTLIDRIALSKKMA